MAVGITAPPYPDTVAGLIERIDETLAEINGPEAEQVDPAWWPEVWEIAKGHAFRLGLPDAVADASRLAPEHLIIGERQSPAARAIREQLRKRLVDLRLKLNGQLAGGADNGEGGNLALTAHSDGWRSVRWYGTTYSFTVNQARVVEPLWKAWEQRTPDVGDETLLIAVDHESPPANLRNLFRTHAAWGTMIVAGGSKGSHRLAEPAKNL